MNAMPLGFVLAAALLIAPEHPIPWSNDEPRHAFAESLRIATDGEGYLAMWDAATEGLCFRHIDAEGRLGEETLDAGSEWLEPLEIVSAGSGYFALVTQRFSPHGPFLIRFDSQGKPIGGRGAPLFTSEPYQRFWDGTLAWNGSRALVALDLGTAVLVDGNGTVVFRDLRFFGPHYFQDEIDILTAAGVGPGFLLFHNGPGGLYSRYVRNDGAMPHPSALIEAHAKGPVAVVSTGDGYALLWAVNGVLRAQRADVEGRPLGPVKELARLGSIEKIEAAWNGTEVVAFVGGAEQASGPIALYRIRLAPDVTPLASGMMRVAGGWASRAEVAASSRGALAFWYESGTCASLRKLLVKRIDDPAAAEVLLTPGAPRQTEPAVAFASGVTATAYWEQRDNLRARVAFLPSGKNLVLSSVAAMSAPAIASNGTSFLAAWLDAGPRSCEPVAFAAALSIDGSLLAPPIRLGASHSAENPPAIVWTDGEYAVLWEGRDPVRVVGARVTADGTLIDTTPVPISPAERGMMISAAWTGSETFVLWTPVNAKQTSARRFTRELQPLGEPFAIAPERGAVFASNGRGGIAVWGSAVAYGRTVSADGTLGPARPLGDFPATRSGVVWDGTRYVVARAGTLVSVEPNLAVRDSQTVAPGAISIAYAPSGIAAAYETPNGIMVRPGAMVRGRAVR